MTYDISTIVEVCVFCAFAFWLVGFCSLLAAVRVGRPEFRAKGYLRPPMGREWFRFLMAKHYEAFGNPKTRFFFDVSRFCLIAFIAVLGAAAILLGCELLLKNVADGP